MKKLLIAVASSIAGVTLGIVISRAIATTNSSGTYSLPNPAFISGTSISSSVMNSNFNDVATELTARLERSGKGAMLAPLRLTNGTNAAPSLTFDSDQDTGLYRIGADNIGIGVASTKILDVASTGLTVTGTGTFSGALTAASLDRASATTMAIGGTNATSITIGRSGQTVQTGGSFGIAAAPTYPLDVQAQSGFTTARFVASGTIPLTVVQTSGAAVVAGNAVHNGTNWLYATSTGASRIEMDPATLSQITFDTAPAGTAGNTATFTNRMKVDTAGVTIGASGTAIAGSFSGSASITPANINAQQCAGLTAITVTGATAGSPCIVGQPAAGANATAVSCAITSANTCTIQLCNGTAGTLTPTAGTYTCRVFQ